MPRPTMPLLRLPVIPTRAIYPRCCAEASTIWSLRTRRQCLTRQLCVCQGGGGYGQKTYSQWITSALQRTQTLKGVPHLRPVHSAIIEVI